MIVKPLSHCKQWKIFGSFVCKELDCTSVDFQGKGSKKVYKCVYYFLVIKVILVTNQILQEGMTQHVI